MAETFFNVISSTTGTLYTCPVGHKTLVTLCRVAGNGTGTNLTTETGKLNLHNATQDDVLVNWLKTGPIADVYMSIGGLTLVAGDHIVLTTSVSFVTATISGIEIDL